MSLLLGLAGLFPAAESTSAATFIVNNTGDALDAAPGDGFCATGGAVCTFRAAIMEANAFAGADFIQFNIAPGGVQTIVLGSALPSITSVVTIDGTTQPLFPGTPIIEINAALGGANAITLSGPGAAGSTIRGLVVNRSPGRAIRILGSSNNVIAGNFVGTNVAGTATLSNQVGVYVGGSIAATNNNRIGGTALADRNVISGSTQDGIQINGAAGGASNNVVQGNYVGVDVNGVLDLGNTNQGVAVFTVAGFNSNNTIGGSAPGAGNLISGNNNMGVLVADTGTTGTVVRGNRIGTDAAGTGPIGNGGAGVHLDNPTANNTIGGTGANEGNRIFFNGQAGVQLTIDTGSGNAIWGNEIHSNGEPGIDLRDDGITANDVGDVDAGANGLQNFPVLTAAMTNGAGSATFAGSLNSAASTAYRIEFFASSAADPSGFGEGERYLGFTNVVTDVAGNAVIGVTLLTALTAGEFVTATATDPTNNTSEFSRYVTAVGSLVVTTTANTVDGTTTSVSNLIAAPGADGRISLHEAILAANATVGADTIRFGIPLSDAGRRYYQNDSIPGSLSIVASTALPEGDVTDFDPDYPTALQRSWYRIRPTVALPAINDPAVLDAATQPGFLVGAPVVELDGSAGGMASGLSLTMGPSTVRGFVISGFTNEGLALRGAVSGHTVTGNYIGTDVSGTVGVGNGDSGIFIGEIGGAPSTIGGSTPADRNIISANANRGLYLWAWGAPGISSQIRIQGNYIGTDVTGTVGLGVQVRGMTLEYTGGHVIGGSNPGEGNVISGNAGFGIELNGDTGGFGTGADNNVIEDNRIGTNATGTATVPNASEGIILFGTIVGSSASNNTIRGNVIAGSGGGSDGIRVGGNADDNLIEGNFIGVDSGGTLDLGNTGSGILILAIGGFLPTGNVVENNVIRFNDLDGVRIEGTGSSATLSQNPIWSNDGLGIDLGADGVTANDGGDGDAGPNDLLNFPFAMAAIEAGGGMLDAYFRLDLPLGSYRVEFFKNPSGADPSGSGEGQSFASSVDVNHAGAGPQNFTHSFAGAVGDVITATTTFCTDGPACTTFGATSEFSAAITATTTAVELISFDAVARDGAVDLSWRTGSELRNLGFHLYRSLEAAGPYERITEGLIAGLGSSPMGASYSYSDEGLANGARYFYKLEDVETTGRTELHGPVSAVPEESGEGERRTTYGDPAEVSFRVLERTSRGVLIELVTGGFFGTPEPDGAVRLEVPGFDDLAPAGSPALPVKRTWLEVVAGRRVSIASVRAFEETTLRGLRPANAGTPEVVASPEGTVRAGSRRAKHTAPTPGVVPATAARLVEIGFQGDSKKALVELAPLRWDDARRELLWARRLQLRLSFAGVESSERVSGGSRGRRHREERSHRSRSVLARLTTSKPGLYRVALGGVVDSRGRSTASASLRLSHGGEAVPFHVASNTLYFLSAGDSVYELESAPGGRTMPVVGASPWGAPVSSSLRRVEWEENRYYQAGLLEAPSLWLWDVVVSPGSKGYSFTLSATLPEEAKLEVFLQGASDFEAAPDHRVRVSVNGVAVGEVTWDGKAAKKLEAPLAPGVLREGANDLSIENAGDTGAPYSMVFLDRFAVTYGRRTVSEGSVFEGSFGESGAVAVEGLPRGSLVVQTSPETAWLRGAEGGSFRVESGRSYVALSPESVLEAKLRRASTSGLRSARNRADYLLVGPREFLSTAEPLLQLRRRQGLLARAVAIEDVYDEFGFGEARPESLKSFIEYAYHHWTSPAPRYLVLFGDATYDRKDYLGTGVPDRVPTLMVKTSYLWTASDPLYAAVNGEDRLPDLALGRLPAATLDEARVLVEKVLEYEESGQALPGRTVLVADDPDAAGDFEADSDEIAASLAGREVQRVYLRELGAAQTRRAIVESLDRGASLLSYVGHGGIALWASENVFEGTDVESLSPQASQPIVMTMNCLNGYFHFPYFDALGEAFVKAKGKGAIAAFSPSGLSLDAPAHLYQQALVAELTSGRHQRLGDAVLAAQRTYAESGMFAELLSIYHLLGDPALQIR